MSNTLAIMITITTYGTWLRGDRRGWVDEGRTYPPDPVLESCDRDRMPHEPYLFRDEQLYDIGQMMGDSLTGRLAQTILALHVGRWHCHLLVAVSTYPVAAIAKCTKDAVRYGLRPGRPIWTDGYDKRYCFDDESVVNRLRHIERHNEVAGLPAKPWNFIQTIDPVHYLAPRQ